MSGMPFSAVIVGVGDDEDFADMEELDADHDVMTDKDGIPACRDIVQFVKYSDFKTFSLPTYCLEDHHRDSPELNKHNHFDLSA